MYKIGSQNLNQPCDKEMMYIVFLIMYVNIML